MSKEAREEDLTGLLENLRDNIFLTLEKKLPAIVESVSDDRTRVKVRPLIAIVAEAGETLQRDSIEGIPVFQMGAGNLLISFPVEPGDLGWIEANDRDISLFLQSYAQSDPGTFRKHSFSDAVFYPDVMTGFQVAEEDAGAVVIQNRDGSVKVAVDQSEVRVKNGGTSWVMSDQNITAIAPGGVDINGFTIGPDGSAASPVSLSAPSIVKGGVNVPDENHTHNAGLLLDSAGQPVTGVTAVSNG